MLFKETTLPGVILIAQEPAWDDRGYFARTFCEREFANYGLCTHFVQHSMSYTARKASIRGMHFQTPPSAETKVVSCRLGAIFDVIIDLRPTSPTYRHWVGFQLSAKNRHALYIPGGIAHGFQTLVDDTEVSYLISEFYSPTAARGVLFDDPAFAISWPLQPTVVSPRDRAWPPFRDVVAVDTV